MALWEIDSIESWVFFGFDKNEWLDGLTVEEFTNSDILFFSW